jgi:hypothetical protein
MPSRTLKRPSPSGGAAVIDVTQASAKYGIDYITKQGILIEQSTIENLTDEYIGSFSQWVDLMKALPDTHRYLVVGGEIVGFWHFLTLDANSFQLAKDGKLVEGSIGLDNLENINVPGEYRGYFVSLSILPGHRSIYNMQLLLNSFVDLLTKLADKNIFIVEWCANALTKEGKAMCKSMKLNYVCDNVMMGQVYHADIVRIFNAPLMKKNRRLHEMYECHLFAKDNFYE